MTDAKSLLNDAAQISVLMEWIERARHILYLVDWVSDSTPEFMALCKGANIPIANAPEFCAELMDTPAPCKPDASTVQAACNAQVTLT